MIIAYKLLRVRKDGSLGPLFIDRRLRVPLKQWLPAEDHPTPGYAHRPGWHACLKPEAPHLSNRGRQWFKVQVDDYELHQRPVRQGGSWVLAKRMRVLEKV
jgi:hypothetical protein